MDLGTQDGTAQQQDPSPSGTGAGFVMWPFRKLAGRRPFGPVAFGMVVATQRLPGGGDHMQTGRDEVPSAPLDAFSERLRDYRKRRRLSQAGLAQLVHVSSAMIAKVERRRRWPTHDLVVRCDAALAAEGALARLWPAMETDRARSQLLNAHERISAKLLAAPKVASHPDGSAGSAAAAFLGVGVWTIITPLKQEAVRSRPVVAMEDVVGAQRLGEVALAHGVAARYETVPIGGQVDLNRPNLVVICGPRLSSHTAALLQEDPHLRFVRGADGVWTLHDLNSGATYRSGLDSDPERSWDIAYLGRRPRPDRQGTLTIFTGIHPQGSLGVVKYLSDHLVDLFTDLGRRCFSVLIATEFHPETSEPISVELMTPFYYGDQEA